MSQIDPPPVDGTDLSPSPPPLPRAPLIARGDTIAVVGTGFAADLADRLGQTVKRIRSEQMHPALEGIPPEAAEYQRFSAAYGEIRSARQFRQLLTRCNRTFRPMEDSRQEGGRFVDPFRPGLIYAAHSRREFDVLHERHMNATRAAFRRATVVLVALSVSEVYETLADGAVLPARPADPDPSRYRARTLDVGQTIADLAAAIDALRMVNPAIRVILTIAPEPLAQTAAPVHPLVADSYGKAVLRFAMDAAAMTPGVSYFPALELLTAAGGYPGVDGAYPAEAIESVARALIELPFDAAETSGGSAAIIPAAAAPGPIVPEPEVEAEPEPAPEPAPAGLRATPLDPYPNAGKSGLRQRRARPEGQPREPMSRLPVADEDEPTPRVRQPRKRAENPAGKEVGAAARHPAAAAAAAAVPEPVPVVPPPVAPPPVAPPPAAPEPAARQDRPPPGMFPRRPQGTLEERKAEKARRLAEFAQRGKGQTDPAGAPAATAAPAVPARPPAPKE